MDVKARTKPIRHLQLMHVLPKNDEAIVVAMIAQRYGEKRMETSNFVLKHRRGHIGERSAVSIGGLPWLDGTAPWPLFLALTCDGK